MLYGLERRTRIDAKLQMPMPGPTAQLASLCRKTPSCSVLDLDLDLDVVLNEDPGKKRTLLT